MTKAQVYRWYQQLWDAVTKYDGYQMFGWDEVTMRINHPGFFSARERLLVLYNSCAE